MSFLRLFGIAAIAVLLAYSIATAVTVQTTLTGAVTTPGAGCSAGNHGLVRGTAIVSNGTLLAEDGCPLVIASIQVFNPDQAAACLWGTNPKKFFANLRSTGGINAVELFAYWGFGWGGQPVLTEAQMFTLTDNILAGAEASGFYVLGSSDGPWASPGWPSGTPPLDQLTAADTRYAKRYNGHTAMMLIPMGEADQQYGWFPDTGKWFDQDYQNVRAVNATIPYIAWESAFTVAEGASGGLDGTTVETMLGTYMPHLWSGGGAVWGWEAYYTTNNGADLSAIVSRVQGNGFPTLQVESNPSDPSQGSPAFIWDINRILAGQSDAFADQDQFFDPDFDGGIDECTGIAGIRHPWATD